VWSDAAYAAPTLDGELHRARDLGARDAGLATELVYGVLRTASALEKQIAAHAKSSRWSRKPWVRAHLLIAVYALSFLDRVPSFAAVSEAVAAIKTGTRDLRMAGFANAVLRKVAREHERSDAEDRGARLAHAIVEATPAWLRAALEPSLGGAEPTRRYLTAGPLPPPICLALGHDHDREPWVEQLRAAAPNAQIEPGEVSPRCIRIRRAGDPRGLPGFQAAWIVQEEGAQVIALAVGAKSGEEVLDACAGRGGKARLLAEAVGPDGAVDAADLHPRKLRRIAQAIGPSAGIRQTMAVDWTRGSGEVTSRYDRVLVDAPCSGVGTLRRRPEIAHRLAASDVARLAALQLAVVRGAAKHVRDGGRLVYAVCSVLREEGEEVVAALTGGSSSETPDETPRLSPAPFDSEVVRELAPEATQLRLLPHRHGTDGYFLASFVVHHL